MGRAQLAILPIDVRVFVTCVAKNIRVKALRVFFCNSCLRSLFNFG